MANTTKPWYKTWKVGVLIFVILLIVGVVVWGALTNWQFIESKPDTVDDDTTVGLKKTSVNVTILPAKSELKSGDIIKAEPTAGYSSEYSHSLLDSNDREIKVDISKPVETFGLLDKSLYKFVVYKNGVVEAKRVYIFVATQKNAASNLRTADFTKFVSNEPVKDLPSLSTEVTGQVVTQQPRLDVVKGTPMRIPFSSSDLDMIAYTMRLQYRRRPVDSNDSQEWTDVAENEYVLLKTERVVVWTPSVDLTDSEVRTGFVKLGSSDVWMNGNNTIQIQYPVSQVVQNTTVTTALLVHATTNQFATSVLYTNNVYRFVLVDSNRSNTYKYYIDSDLDSFTSVADSERVYIDPKYNGKKIRIKAIDQNSNVVYAVSSDTSAFWYTVGTEMFFVNTELDLDKYKTCYSINKTMFISIPVTVYGDPTKLALTFSYVYAADDTETTTAVDLEDNVYSWEEVYSSVSNYHDYMLHLSIDELPDNMVNYPFKIIATSATNSSKTPYYFRNSKALEPLAVNANSVDSYNVKQIVVNDQVGKGVPLAQNLSIRWVVDGVGTSVYNVGYRTDTGVVYIAKNYPGTTFNWKVPTELIDKVSSIDSKLSISLFVTPVSLATLSTSYMAGLVRNVYLCDVTATQNLFYSMYGTQVSKPDALPVLYSLYGRDTKKVQAASKVVDDVVTYGNDRDFQLVTWSGYIKIDSSDTYQFRFQVVDDTASMIVDDVIVAESMIGTNTGEGKSVYLTEGYHKFSAMLFDHTSTEWLVPQMKKLGGEYADIPKTMYYYKSEDLTSRNILPTQLDLKSIQYTPYYAELKPYTTSESKRQVYYNDAVKMYVSVSWFGGEFVTLPLQMLDKSQVVIQFRASGVWNNVSSYTLFNDYFECNIPAWVSKSALQIRFVYGKYFQALSEFAIDLLDDNTWYLIDSEGKVLKRDNIVLPGSVVSVENKNYYTSVKTNVNTTTSYTIKLLNSEGTTVNSVKKVVPDVRSYFALYYAFPNDIDVNKTYTLVLNEGDSSEVTKINVYVGGSAKPLAHVSVKDAKEIKFNNIGQRLLRSYKSGHPGSVLAFRFRGLSTLPKTAAEVNLMEYSGIRLCTNFVNGRRTYYTMYKADDASSTLYQQALGSFYSVADGEPDSITYVLSVARSGVDKMCVTNWFHHGSWLGWEPYSYGSLNGPYLNGEVPVRTSIVDYEKDLYIKFFPGAVFDSVVLYEYTDEYTLGDNRIPVFSDKTNTNINEFAALLAFSSGTYFEDENTFSNAESAKNKYGLQKLAYFNFNNVSSGYATNEFTGVSYDIKDSANVNVGLIDDPSVIVDGNRAYFLLAISNDSTVTYYVNDTKIEEESINGSNVIRRKIFDNVKSGDKVKILINHTAGNAWFAAKYYWDGNIYYSKAGDTLINALNEEALNSVEVFSSRVDPATLLPDLGSHRHNIDFLISPYSQILWNAEGSAATLGVQKLRFEYVLA
jgi:hypothetical protein